MRIQLSLTGMCDTVLYRVKSFYICGCELSITFKSNHKYTINGISNVLSEVGITIGNFIFKGLYSDDYTEDNLGILVPLKEVPENGETTVLCMIPECIREQLSVVAIDD